MADDSGETLLESLIALMVIGIGVAAVLGAVAMSSTLSFDHRKAVTADVVMKRVAESLKVTSYKVNACAGTGQPCSYAVPAVPTGYSAAITSVTCVPAGNAASWDARTFPACTVSDNGLQLLRIVVDSTDGRFSDATQVMKRQQP